MDKYNCEEISIEITSLCHHACKHCSTNGAQTFLSSPPEICRGIWEKHRDKYDELTTQEIKDAITSARDDIGSKTVSFSGGEPTLFPDFPELVAHAKSLGMRVLIYTCCPPMFRVERFKQFSHMLTHRDDDNPDKVIFSLEGGWITHDFIVGTELHRKEIISAIESSVRFGIYTEVHTCPMTANMDELINMFRDCEHMGVDRISYLRLVPQGRCQRNRWLMPDVLDFCLMQLIMGYIHLEQKKGRMDARVGDPMNFLWLVMDDAPISTCSAAKDRILIRPDGAAHFCAALKHAEELNYGNIRKDSLSHIWNESDVVTMLRDMHCAKQDQFFGECCACAHFNKCRGGCLSQRLSHYKTSNGIKKLDRKLTEVAMLRGPDPACPFQFLKKKYRQWKANDTSATFLTYLLHERYGWNDKNIPAYWNKIAKCDKLAIDLRVR